ncbi:MAG: hypothetical protein Q4F72_12700, partial [Desulfovibrionaceae bacterium]|nr:hypothetical protein [Desulfovibrionaceae bacterium]
MAYTTPARHGCPWVRDELILVFALYCRIPFGRIHHTNPKIIELAALLQRTPGSVALKMGNLAHCDPVHQKRGVDGNSHGSRLDGEVFEEFASDMVELAMQEAAIKARLLNKD